jgi:hypothetical protein
MINEGVERITATEQLPPDTNMPKGTARERGRTEEGNRGGVIGAIKDKAQEPASTLADKAGRAWDTTRDQARHVASLTAAKAEDTFDWATACMRRHPYSMLLTLFSVGFLLGQTFRRLA